MCCFCTLTCKRLSHSLRVTGLDYSSDDSELMVEIGEATGDGSAVVDCLESREGADHARGDANHGSNAVREVQRVLELAGTGTAIHHKAQPCGKSITVPRYPRLEHSEGSIRLVCNDALGVYDMRAECRRHVQCTLNRASKKKPLAMLWSWLDAAQSCATKQEHKRMLVPYAKRREARRALRENPEAADWIKAEREQRPDNDHSASEPEHVL